MPCRRRSRLIVAVAAFVVSSLALCRPAVASCGAASCPIDLSTHVRPERGALTLDLSFQYIDQDRPRVGQRRAAVGEIPNPHHDEVATINRLWTARVEYDFSSRWGATLVLPLVARAHDHVEVKSGDTEHWGFTGFGDLVALARYTVVAADEPASPSLTVDAGVKLPTGRTHARNDSEEAEITVQPGSGSYDLVAGFSYSQSVGRAPMASGQWAAVPIFASFTYKQNNPGKGRYRMGDELQANVGAACAVIEKLDVLGQANLRVKMRDYNGDTDEDTSFTGGNAIYLSPGLRWRLTPTLSAYGYLQLPVYQRVNQEQLTSARNWLFGLSARFGS